jgi:hypothetical protein
MPFKKAARIQITNESKKRLSHIFYDINFQETTAWNENNLYFHAYWHRDTATQLGKDFELLPMIKARGKVPGCQHWRKGKPRCMRITGGAKGR